jgi:hypothetical protein
MQHCHNFTEFKFMLFRGFFSLNIRSVANPTEKLSTAHHAALAACSLRQLAVRLSTSCERV